MIPFGRRLLGRRDPALTEPEAVRNIRPYGCGITPLPTDRTSLTRLQRLTLKDLDRDYDHVDIAQIRKDGTVDVKCFAYDEGVAWVPHAIHPTGEVF